MARAKTEIVQISDSDWAVIKKYKNGNVEKRVVKDKIDIWLIGNTGMRNPWRIPEGFKIYAESDMVGHLRTPEEQRAFKRLLAYKGAIGGDPEKDKDASITRKYRLIFSKFGFTYPEVTSKDGFSQEEIGPVDDITPLGKVFYHATTKEMQQECFLRGLIVPMEAIDSSSTAALLPMAGPCMAVHIAVTLSSSLFAAIPGFALPVELNILMTGLLLCPSN